MQFHSVARDKACLAVHSELFAVLAFYFPSQSKLWQMKLLIRYEGRHPMLICTYTLCCAFQGPSAGFPGQSRLGGRERGGKDPMDRAGAGLTLQLG